MKHAILAIFSGAALAIAAVACGGGSDSAGGVGGSDVRSAANSIVLTYFEVLSGKKKPEALLEIYAPECRVGVDIEDIRTVVGFVQVFAPELAQAKIEGIDLGELNVVTNGDMVSVSPVNPDGLKFKVAGKFVNATDYLNSLAGGNKAGGVSSSVTSVPGAEAVTFVRRDGRYFVSDCDDIQNMSGASTVDTNTGGGFSSAPTAAPTGPGSSRSNPVAFGNKVTVEGVWELSVVKVNDDAWPELEKDDDFYGDEPKANEKLLLIRVHARNVSKEEKPQSISDFELRLIGSRNELYSSYDEKSSCGFVPDDLDADLFPGGETEGNICFKVPADEKDFLLVWEPFFGEGLTYLKLK